MGSTYAVCACMCLFQMISTFLNWLVGDISLMFIKGLFDNYMTFFPSFIVSSTQHVVLLTQSMQILLQNVYIYR